MGQCSSTSSHPARWASITEYEDNDDGVDSIEKPYGMVTVAPASPISKSAPLGYISPKLDSQCKYMLPILVRMASNSSALRILDVGCGSGALTVNFAKALPSSSITGVDISSAILASAKVFARQQNILDVHFRQADVHRLPFASGSFDVVLVQQALAYFSDRTAAISEMLRVARKGGIICLREGDLSTGRFWPQDKALEECFDVIRRLHESDGGPMDAGMRLRVWVREAGIPSWRIKGSCSSLWYQTPEERRAYGGHWPARCLNGVFRDRAMEVGVTSERLDDYALAWRRWIEEPEGVFSMMHGEVIIMI